MTKYSDSSPVSDGGQTNIGNDVTERTDASFNCYVYLDIEDTPAASNTSGWTWTTARYHAIVAGCLKPAADTARKLFQAIIME